MERLHIVDHAWRRQIKRGSLGEGFGSLSVQLLLSKSLSTLDAAPHLGESIASRSSGGGGLLELKALLIRHKHLLPQLSVLVAFRANKSYVHGGEASGGCALATLPSKSLAEDELVRHGPKFIWTVLRSQFGHRKVNISEQSLREDGIPGEGRAG